MRGPENRVPGKPVLEGIGQVEEIRNLTTTIKSKVADIEGVLGQGIGNYTEDQMDIIRLGMGVLEQSLESLVEQLNRRLRT